MSESESASEGAGERMKSFLSRRDFMRTGAAAGTGLLVSSSLPFGISAAASTEDIKVGIIGTGVQGRVLIEAAVKIPGIRFTAVCDIWEYSQRYGSGTLRKYGFPTNVYTDYQEMLEKEKDLDAVIIATPDFMHAPMTIDCLNAGLHVYCEKMMSNTIEDARKMVKAARDTGKLLQIGHQRRSNPRYIYGKNKLIEEAELLGRITNVNGQWNRAVSEDLGWPDKYEIPQEKLERFGYKNMHEFRNWRWYKKYGGGPISDLGAHQIDIYHWFLNNKPKTVMASGGVDYYKNHEWYDNVMAIYEFDTTSGPVRAFYQVLTTTSAGGGYFEYFMGTEGAFKISENPKFTQIFRENNAPEWKKWDERGYISKLVDSEDDEPQTTVDVRETAALSAWEMPVELNKPIHQPHVENFLDAIRGKAKLNCPAEEAFITEVTVLKVNEAVEKGCVLEFSDEDFEV